MKLSSVSEPSFPPTSTLIASFHSFFPDLFIPLHLLMPCLPVPSPFCSSFLVPLLYDITPLHPSAHLVFSLFYSIVFPSTESSNVQGPDAAGCHHGVEVSIQFTSNPCGSQHPSPSYHTCCGYCHL